ncbi:hypothetical protein BVC71_12120 [Marivivens niveibacter]|uniref:LysM domain-containing protein n=1 Tax=Marivivens niveibacter TaxID=1930667 RepID=A0A251WWM2_9RHOB|nr:LysM peptidoglycan-binding domain-containing M23 family metallopeptidase [Marivivens niveibacter]OUD08671.1 hypothetical protein BVC71_12120 [Marivivens niveibacter]
MMNSFTGLRAVFLAGTAATLMSGCMEGGFDFDLRDLGGSALDTTSAAQNLPSRPTPDDRGVISYPNYQVAIATRGDTVTTIAQRLSINPGELARANALSVNTALNQGAVLVLPGRVAEPTIATGATIAPGASLATGEIDVTTLAAAAIDRAGPQSASTTAAPVVTSTPIVQGGVEPLRHTVQSGETAYTIARLYNLPVRTVAEWNGLGADLSVREGQSLLIPQSGVATASDIETSAPGQGTQTPTPPSAATPLPTETPAAAATVAVAPIEAPVLETTAPAIASDAPLIYPVRGTIVRAYSAGSNDGIDISTTAGSDVVAAAAGSVAAITKDTNNVAIVVIRHATDLLTVYTNVDNVTISEGATVSQGQKIGVVKSGDPAVVHFEVRLSGMKSADPEDYLP